MTGVLSVPHLPLLDDAGTIIILEPSLSWRTKQFLHMHATSGAPHAGVARRGNDGANKAGSQTGRQPGNPCVYPTGTQAPARLPSFDACRGSIRAGPGEPTTRDPSRCHGPMPARPTCNCKGPKQIPACHHTFGLTCSKPSTTPGQTKLYHHRRSSSLHAGLVRQPAAPSKQPRCARQNHTCISERQEWDDDGRRQAADVTTRKLRRGPGADAGCVFPRPLDTGIVVIPGREYPRGLYLVLLCPPSLLRVCQS